MFTAHHGFSTMPTMEMVKLTEIKKVDGSGLALSWSDQRSALVPAKLLRTHCPCAECRERRGDGSHEKPLGSATGGSKPKGLRVLQSSLEEELTINAIWGVGSYALGIRWADGHDSGIYTFDYLRELSALASAASNV